MSTIELALWLGAISSGLAIFVAIVITLWRTR
jgi:hypothetical protein